MRFFLYILSLVLFLFADCGQECLAVPKKKRQQRTEQSAPPPSAYDKLFKDRHTVSSEGLITFRMTDDGKLYAEFPKKLLGRRLLYASVIERTSDPGEGAVGQYSDNNVPMCFEVRDSMLCACVLNETALVNHSGDTLCDASIGIHSIPGIWKQFRVLAATNDDEALVVEMSDLFMSTFTRLETFPKDAYNSMNGQVMRVHTPMSGKGSLVGVYCTDDYASVVCDQSFDLDGYVYGFMQIYGEFSLRAVVRKMFYLPPETPMQSRFADSRAGVQPVECTALNDVNKPLDHVWRAKRWRLEPSDSAAYMAGEKVAPVKPIVFHIDTMMPPQWRPYVREGVLAWNDAFEKIGFRDVVNVRDFPRDTAFHSTSPYVSTIRFSSCGKTSCDCSVQTDSRTGEILNATVCLHRGMLERYGEMLRIQTGAAHPLVRTEELPEDMLGTIIRAAVMQSVGKSLGLDRNPGASYAYPVDSLRSASFTSRYGIVSSVMEDMVFNYVAQPEDVAKGVRLVQDCLGPTDYQTIRWLYAPVSGAESPQDEVPVLERWIEESAQHPYTRFRSTVISSYDPTAFSGDLGDDLFKTVDYLTANYKRMAEHFYGWFAEDDGDLEFRSGVFSSMTDFYAGKLCMLQRYIGGLVFNDIREGDDSASYIPLPRETQQRALHYIVAALRNLDWLDRAPVRRMPYGTSEYVTEIYRVNIMRSTIARLGYVAIAGQSQESAYSPQDFLQDLYDEIFGNIRKGNCTSYEKDWQLQMMDLLIAESGLKEMIERRQREALARSMAKRKAMALELGLTVEPDPDTLWTDMDFSEDISGEEASANGDFYPTAPSKGINIPASVAPWSLKTLRQLRKELHSALPGVDVKTREHYQFMIYSIDRAFSVKP